jgi:tripartite-type tricarboxylate transporter receptor subunit TctC
MTPFRSLCCAATAAVLLTAASIANAQQWPTRPIRVISPFPPGSASDTTGRVVLDQLSQLLGQPMGLRTRPGPVG